jgi:hypothetical protein
MLLFNSDDLRSELLEAPSVFFRSAEKDPSKEPKTSQVYGATRFALDLGMPVFSSSI